ncbi:MAG TPA: YicC/YloC family endoribonuclease [Burkholderiales bacterium]|nr:YicC/YloC family endoribonuclease [Burkholderiales bacterium]
MILSMTGYAALSRELPFGTLNLELRSVNHRYLDIQFRMPDELRPLETALRELLGAELRRGKVDCRIGFTATPAAQSATQLNQELLARLADFDRQVRAALPDAAPLRAVDVLRWPGMFGPETLPAEALRDACLDLARSAVTELSATRQREGAKLKAIVADRAGKVRALTAAVAPRMPALVASYKEKLVTRLKEALGGLDDERLHQELSLFAAKIDVDEELSRLGTHLDELLRVLEAGGAAGKRLDFLMQELHREANTLGSKSVDAEVSRVSMEMKVLIEQMREQVQNIE